MLVSWVSFLVENYHILKFVVQTWVRPKKRRHSVRMREINLAVLKIKELVDNESAWNYLRAVMEHNLIKYPNGKLYYRQI